MCLAVRTVQSKVEQLCVADSTVHSKVEKLCVLWTELCTVRWSKCVYSGQLYAQYGGTAVFIEGRTVQSKVEQLCV